MDLKYAPKIALELNLKLHQVENTAKLLMEDATVPFISRYRKELTGSLDEVESNCYKRQTHSAWRA